MNDQPRCPARYWVHPRRQHRPPRVEVHPCGCRVEVHRDGLRVDSGCDVHPPASTWQEATT